MDPSRPFPPSAARQAISTPSTFPQAEPFTDVEAEALALPARVEEPKLLTTGQVAELFGVSARTLWNWRRHHGLCAVKPTGRSLRYRSVDIEKFIDKNSEIGTLDRTESTTTASCNGACSC